MPTILIQLDTDPQASTFDAVVAVDAGVDHLLQYRSVTPEQITGLVHGAMFTRKPADLRSTAIFIGGSQVAQGEALFAQVLKTFFGPVRVSVMLDSNGSNTTAAAAVLAAKKHVDLSRTTAVVLGGTGPVGLRVAQLLAQEGATVRLASRNLAKARAACQHLAALPGAARITPWQSEQPEEFSAVLPGAGQITPWQTEQPEEVLAACADQQLLIAAGAAGTRFLTADQWQNLPALRVAIDVNAVAPLGLEGIEVFDKATDRGGKICYGAIGVGGTKMKIHTACLKSLFTTNDQVLDTAAIFAIGAALS